MKAPITNDRLAELRKDGGQATSEEIRDMAAELFACRDIASAAIIMLMFSPTDEDVISPMYQKAVEKFRAVVTEEYERQQRMLAGSKNGS